MNSASLFDAFSLLDTDAQTAAAASMEAPISTLPRPRLRFALIAASFLLIAAMIPILVILARHTTQPPLPPTPVTSDSETSSTPSTEAPTTHLSITDIPGAIPVDTDKIFSVEPSVTDPLTIEDFIRYSIYWPTAVGTAIHINTVLIPDNEDIWNITVFDLIVSDAINQLNTNDAVRIVTYCRYDKNGVPIMSFGFPQSALQAIENPKALYVLMKFELSPQIIVINGRQYDLSQYADYFFSSYYETDGITFNYLGTNIPLDAIRNK